MVNKQLRTVLGIRLEHDRAEDRENLAMVVADCIFPILRLDEHRGYRIELA